MLKKFKLGRKKNTDKNKDEQYRLVKDIPTQHTETTDGKTICFHFGITLQ